MAKKTDFLSVQNLRDLVETQEFPCFSIFMPAHRTNAEQNRIRFKNLLEHMDRLIEGEQSADINGNILEPARDLVRDLPFWQHQSYGLALFMSDGKFQKYRLPLSFQELAIISDRFHIKPVLPLLTSDMKFYIVALSQKHVRLFRCSRQVIEKIEPKGMPKNLEEALKYDEPESQLQFRTGAAGTNGRRPAIFHGHGVGKDDDKDRILQYFQVIDKCVHTVFRNESSPLVPAGTEFHLPLYKEANSYPHMFDQGISVNPDELDETELHERALAFMAPHLRKAQDEAAAKYRDHLGTGKTSNELEEIIRSAVEGRVSVLFLAEGVQQWGRFDPDRGTIDFHENQTPLNGDLLNLAALHTIMTGGDVYVVKKEEVPDDSAAAALFRY